jgi:DNA-binding GntR family transcriptional regulator
MNEIDSPAAFGRFQMDSEKDALPLRANSLTAQAYERLRRLITEGALPANEPLVIAKLVRSYGVSHTPVREALARLHSEGLVNFTENVGYRVANAPTAIDLEQWMEARLQLEVAASKLAAQRISDDQLERLRDLNAQIESKVVGSEFESVRFFADLNAGFHRTLVEATNNPFLWRAHEQIWLGSFFSRGRLSLPTDYPEIVAEHAAIVDALERHDSEAAASAMARHIVDSLNRDKYRRGAS